MNASSSYSWKRSLDAKNKTKIVKFKKQKSSETCSTVMSSKTGLLKNNMPQKEGKSCVLTKNLVISLKSSETKNFQILSYGKSSRNSLTLIKSLKDKSIKDAKPYHQNNSFAGDGNCENSARSFVSSTVESREIKNKARKNIFYSAKKQSSGHEDDGFRYTFNNSPNADMTQNQEYYSLKTEANDRFSFGSEGLNKPDVPPSNFQEYSESKTLLYNIKHCDSLCSSGHNSQQTKCNYDYRRDYAKQYIPIKKKCKKPVSHKSKNTNECSSALVKSSYADPLLNENLLANGKLGASKKIDRRPPRLGKPTNSSRFGMKRGSLSEGSVQACDNNASSATQNAYFEMKKHYSSEAGNNDKEKPRKNVMFQDQCERRQKSEKRKHLFSASKERNSKESTPATVPAPILRSSSLATDNEEPIKIFK